MSEMAKAARAAMKNKAKRLGTTDPSKKVDASSWSPPEPLNADVKTGLRPVSRRAYKKGGKVEGAAAKMHAGRKPRKSGGEASMYANAKINRNVKDANDEREGTKHIGGMKKGGRAHKNDGGSNGQPRVQRIAPGVSGLSPEQAAKWAEKTKLDDYKMGPGFTIAGPGSNPLDKDRESQKKGGRAKKEHGGGLYEGNKRVVSPTATRAAPESKSSAPQNAPMPPRRPADLPKDKGMTAEEAQKFMESRKRGGRTKKEHGGPSGSGYEYMSMHTTPGKADEYMTRQYANEREPNIMSKANRKAYEDIKKFKEDNKQIDLKRGGRAKKQMGGMLPGDPRLDIVKRQAMNFQGNPVTPGAKKGGKIERHPDEAMDKALIKQMVKKEARTGKAHGGTKRMNRKDGGMALDGEIQGTRPTGGRLARANGGADRNKGVAKRAERAASFGPRHLSRLERIVAERGESPGRMAAINALRANPNLTQEQVADAVDAAGPVRDQARQAPNRSSNGGPGRNRPAPAPAPAPAAPVPAAAMMDTRGGSPMQGGTMGPGNIRPLPAQPMMMGYGNDMLYPGQMPPGAMAPQTGGGYPLPPMTGGGYPIPPQTGGGYPLPMYQPQLMQQYQNFAQRAQPMQQQPQQAQAAPASAPAQAFKRGGRAKGKTDINIVISAGPKGGPAMPPGMMPPPGPPMVPPPPPQMGAGGPPGGAPPMPPGPPMGMPMGGPPGMPPGMGMPRKSGGRITPKAKSFSDMKAGAGSGEGRLQKTDIAEYKRGQHRAGGKVYRSYEDMDAGAGSGLGRLEKTEIQSRKR